MRWKTLAIASCLGLLSAAYAPSARADEWNKKTILTVHEPLAIPGTVLQPGKYVVKLADSQSNRHIVQIFNEDESKLQTTVLAIPNYRLEAADKSLFAFWETSAGQPRALKAWFYPGDNFGQEFAYPKEMATQIAKASNENVPAIVSREDNLGQAEVKEVTPSGQEEAMNMGQPQTGENQAATTATAASQSSSSTSSAQTTTTTSSVATTTETGQPSSEATAQTRTEAAPSTAATPSTAENTPNSTGGQTGAATTPASGQMTQPGSQAAASPRRLPRTGSPLPLAGLLGLLSLAAAGAARAGARRLR